MSSQKSITSRNKSSSVPKIGVLLSGGLDSAALVQHYLNKGFDIWPVYVRCGFGWENAEINTLRKLLRTFNNQKIQSMRILSISLQHTNNNHWSRTGKVPGFDSSEDAVYLPARNFILISQSLYDLHPTGVRQLAIATLKGNPFADGQKSFFRRFEKLLSDSFSTRIRIHSPFNNLTKNLIIQRYQRAPLYLSFSCLNPKKGIHCGVCNKCAERKKAFRLAKVKDKTTYINNPSL